MAWFELPFSAYVNREGHMDDPVTLPDPTDDTVPNADVRNELVEAIEWLHKRGVVSGERPAFVGFFDEVAHSGEGPHEP